MRQDTNDCVCHGRSSGLLKEMQSPSVHVSPACGQEGRAGDQSRQAVLALSFADILGEGFILPSNGSGFWEAQMKAFATMVKSNG